MTDQSKKDSAKESLLNTFLGFILSAAAYRLIFERNMVKSILVTLFFTCLSILRNYFVRRFFNGIRRVH